jgi:voltage-gated potassium channel
VTLKQIVEESDTRAGRAFDLLILSLIVLSIVSFSIETLPGLSPVTQQVLRWIEIVTVLLFTVEYGVRLAVADSRLRFATSFYGIIDLLAILPFYLGLAVDLRGMRTLRLLRLFRILKLARHLSAIDRFRSAFYEIRAELSVFAVATLFVVYLASMGIYYFERDAQPEEFASVFHAMWWTLATLTTVGYGDVYPVTVGGRVFTALVLFAGLGLVAVPSGLLAAALSKSVSRPE